MFSRIKVFFILLLFIQSRIVYGVNIHYCGNHIANLSYLYDAEGCEMHNPKYGKNHHISQKTCCYDKVLFYDKNQLETESKIILLYQQYQNFLHQNYMLIKKIALLFFMDN